MTFRVILFCGITFFAVCTWAMPVDESGKTDPVLAVFAETAQDHTSVAEDVHEASESQPGETAVEYVEVGLGSHVVKLRGDELDDQMKLAVNENLEQKAKMGWNWRCPSMEGKATDCVHISHNNWFNNKAKFQATCDGELDGFYERGHGAQNLRDCGRACWGCSFLQACCIGRVTSITARYDPVGHISATSREITVTEGVSVGRSITTSITAAMERSFSVGIENLFSAGASSSLSATVDTTYSHTRTSTYSVKENQPAQSRLWQYVIDFHDVYGVTRSLKAGTVLTADNDAPRCQPGRCSDRFVAAHAGKAASGSCRQCTRGYALSDVSSDIRRG